VDAESGHGPIKRVFAWGGEKRGQHTLNTDEWGGARVRPKEKKPAIILNPKPRLAVGGVVDQR